MAVKEITRVKPSVSLVTLANDKQQNEADKQSFHFVGIGGCGMSGLAQVLVQRGYRVSGSDRHASPVTTRLEGKGIDVHYCHDKSYVPEDVDCLVISAAVKEDNPELQEARRRGILILKYAEMLGELSRTIATYAVAGTHGKSTTSGWLTFVLTQAQLSPSYIIGAEVSQFGSGSGAGKGNMLVVEACEYDRSFLNLTPQVGAILNIEGDHFDYYRDMADIEDAFGAFASLVHVNGLLVGCGEDARVRKIFSRQTKRRTLFAVEGGLDVDWAARGLQYDQGRGRFELCYKGEAVGQVALVLAGRHNVSNALAVAAMAHEAGVSFPDICSGLSTYSGVGRRMTFKGVHGGITILDDYAHHPTEIRVTLEAIKARYNPKRLWCIFQPHQHSRTRFLLDEFAFSFGAADVVLLPDIYFVRDSEAMKREISAANLADKIVGNGGDAQFLDSFESILSYLLEHCSEGDLVVTMGAGDIWKLGDDFIQRLKSAH